MRRGLNTVVLAALLCVGSAAASAQEDLAAEKRAVRMPGLPPAQFDETLAIGGEEIGARKLRSRMTVDVLVNGTGPHKFVVDSGADTSVVGERLAGKLAMPEGTPTMLHGVTESKMVDRVMVDELQLGPTATTDLELPVLDERDLGGDGMIGLDALVRGGTLDVGIEVRDDATEIVVRAAGPKIAFDPVIGDALGGRMDPAELTGRTAPAHLLAMLADKEGGLIQTHAEVGTLLMGATLPNGGSNTPAYAG